MRHFFIILLGGILWGTSLTAQKEEQETNPIGQIIKDFSLVNVNDSLFSTSANSHIKGYIIVFTCNHCPFARLYTQRLNDLYSKYVSKGVTLLAINPMDTLVYEDETFAFMKARAEKEKYQFPYLQDARQVVGKRLEPIIRLMLLSSGKNKEIGKSNIPVPLTTMGNRLNKQRLIFNKP